MSPLSDFSSLYGPTSTLVIACAGAGVLAFPYAMYRAGLIMGIAVTLALGGINWYAMRIITRMSVPITKDSPHFAECLQRARDINAKTTEDCNIHTGTDMVRTISYIDLMYILLGKTYGNIAKTAVFVGTLGGLIAFLIIISDLAAPVLHEYGPDDSVFTSRPFVIVAFVVFVVFPLSVVPDLESLTISSVIAVVTIVYVGFVVVIESCAHSFASNFSSVHLQPKNEYSVFQSIPLILFAFAGILQVVSVMGEMAWDERGRTVGDMNIACKWTVIICASIYIIVGAFGFIQFGDDTEGVILDNYDSDDILANTGRLSMAVHVALAYPVILFPAQQSLLHSVIMPLYKHLTNAGSRKHITDPSARKGLREALHHPDPVSPSPMFQGSKMVAVEVTGNDEVINSVLHAGIGHSDPQRQGQEQEHTGRTYSMEVLDAEETPLILRILSAMCITFFTAAIAILLPQAEIVFGFMGSLVGSTLVLILPAVLALKYECGPGASEMHRHSAKAMLIFGIAIAIFGFSLNAIAVSNS